MSYHNKNISEVAGLLKTDLKNGLSDSEAEKRLKTNGMNVIREKKKVGAIKKFFSQFNDFMVIILLFAAAISFLTSWFEQKNDFADPIIILSIVIANAIMGFVQENKAEHSIEALRKMTTPTAKVIRNGVLKNIPAAELTVGDLININLGDYIPADARLVSCNNLKVDESALTGESMPSEKDYSAILKSDALLADRINMVYCGSFVSYGRGQAIVTATGMNAEVGKIADMIMSDEQNQTPLQKKLDHTGKVLGIGALGICAVIFVIGLLRKIPAFEMFMTSVSLAVAAIPEGLPAIVTIVLAIGVRRMAKKNAIIKKLPAVETLGCANVICSDKTGTLTQNKMRVTEIKNYINHISDNKRILELACLCNNAVLKENGETIGTSTETALLLAAYDAKINKNLLEKKYERTEEIAFDSKRKLMTTVHKYDNRYLIITKGAPDVLLTHCKYFMDCENKIKKELDSNIQKKIASDNRDMAQKALRVLGIAYKECSSIKDIKDIKDSELEDELIFAGLFGIIDPPREEVYEAVKKCKTAGIKTVMITGDHLATAEAIAKKLGIMRTNDKSMSGVDLSNISDEELTKNIFDYSVFARVAPEHKVKIVKAFQNNQAVVAMTGDGVNDAPALKTADIGCAMGITGTDVAKSAADMILTDDNFSTIVEAVREGRGIYSNIKKSVHFLLSSNIGELITIFMAILFGWKSPLLAIQLLWVNLVTDSLPAIALGLEPPEENIMRRAPIKNSQGLFTKDLWQRIVIEGAMIGMISLIAYGIGNVFYNLTAARTMAFATLSISQLIHTFNIRTNKSIFKSNLFNNIYMIGAFIICCMMQVSVITIKPLAKIFHVQSLIVSQWLYVILLSLVPILIVELEKFFQPEKQS